MAERGGFIAVSKCTDPSGKYFASLLFCGENQTAEKRLAEKFIGIDFAIQGMCVFSTGESAKYPMFYRNTEKKLAREQRKEELSLSERIYYCECGNRMDRDVNAAVNIMNEGKRIFAECA